MRWGRPIKTHLPRGGYPTLQDFCAVYGLDLRFAFCGSFCAGMLPEYSPNTKQYPHTYAFCLHWCTCQSVCALSCIMYARMRMLAKCIQI